MLIQQHVPLVSIIFLILSGFISLLFRNSKQAKIITLSSLSIVLIGHFWLLKYFVEGAEAFTYSIGHYPAPWGNELKITAVEVILSFVFTIISIITLIASTKINRKIIEESKRKSYYIMMNILMASLLALIYTNDIFSAYVFLEINTICASSILASKMDGDSIRATIKYYVMSAIGSTMFLFGIGNLYAITGQLAMEPIHDVLTKLSSTGQYNMSITITLVLLIVGISVKSGLFPFHTWSPDAYSVAPPSSSAVLSGLVSKGYVYLGVKVIYRVFGINNLENLHILPIILTLGLMGMFSGSIFALFQKDIRRMAAYSSVAQIGYIFTAMGLGTVFGGASAIFHIIHHAISKSALFLSIGNITYFGNVRDTKKINGLGILMPVTLILFTIASFSMIGIPPTIGFNSKWYMIEAMLGSNYQWVVILLSISTLLNAAYFLPIVFRSYFGVEAKEYLENKEAFKLERSWQEILPIMFLIVAIFVLAFASRPMYDLIVQGLANI